MAYREGVQMVWQDPFGSLNPTHNIFHQQVGLIPPKETAQKFPHQLSGGQRQRVGG